MRGALAIAILAVSLQSDVHPQATTHKEVIEEINEESLAKLRARRAESGAWTAVADPPGTTCDLAPSAAASDKSSAARATEQPVTQQAPPPNLGGTYIARPKAPDTKPHLIMLTRETWRPITAREKFGLWVEDITSPMTHLSLAADAGFSWSTNDRSYLGPGAAGFGKRYGFNVADEASGIFMSAFLFPILFQEDPRYLPMDKGPAGKRAAYALSRIFVTRTDSGGSSFNRSNVLGAFASSALSNLYYPRGRDSSAAATIARAGVALGTEAAFNLFKEFWPDVARRMKLNLFFQNLVRRSIHAAARAD